MLAAQGPGLPASEPSPRVSSRPHSPLPNPIPTHHLSPRSLFGLKKQAQKLSVGYAQWAMNNDFKNDTQLLFASASLTQLHARIEPEERRDYLLTWRPPRQEGDAGDGEPEHAAAQLGWRQYSLNCLAGALVLLHVGRCGCLPLDSDLQAAAPLLLAAFCRHETTLTLSPPPTLPTDPPPTGILRQLTGVLAPEEVAVPGRPGEVIKHQYLHIR